MANVDLLNKVGYDFITIGNNEGITFDYADLDRLYRKAGFQVLVNNLLDSTGKKPAGSFRMLSKSSTDFAWG